MKTVVVGARSNLLLLEDRRGKLVWSADEKASLSLAHFYTKQYRDSSGQPHSCDLSRYCVLLPFSPDLFVVCFWDPYGGNDLDRMFPLSTSRWLGS